MIINWTELPTDAQLSRGFPRLILIVVSDSKRDGNGEWHVRGGGRRPIVVVVVVVDLPGPTTPTRELTLPHLKGFCPLFPLLAGCSVARRAVVPSQAIAVTLQSISINSFLRFLRLLRSCRLYYEIIDRRRCCGIHFPNICQSKHRVSFS